jgi:glycosyltransferase involved in cell wall biosynthesis
VLSTFGLLNPDKGIEYILQALPPLVERYPDLLFLIIGETHPAIRRHSGEQYRESLQALIDERGLGAHVQFVNQYLTLQDLLDYLIATDIYLMAYLNPNQIVSGTLAYALGSGKAVVATPFRYAQEMLANERGVIVPFRAPEALTAALDDLIKHPARRAAFEDRAYAYSRSMEWHNVAAEYHAVFRRHIKAASQALNGVALPGAATNHA